MRDPERTSASRHSSPAFGQADLATCEHELIHIPGSVQPHGVLLAVAGDDHTIVQVTVNAAERLGLAPAALLGRPVTDFTDDESLARLLARAPEGAAVDEVVHGRVRLEGRDFLASVHRTPEQGTVVELEPAPTEPPDRLPAVSVVLDHVSTAVTLDGLCAGFAQLFRTISGYDRVMVYRFDADGHGEVLAEDRRDDLDSFLGNHYPASDIPERARQLYVRNRVRILADVDYVEQSLEPRLSPVDGRELDMSMCSLRSLSPIHLQYLRNMGVAATLVSSIMVNGRLWGLVACHHYTPRLPPPDLRGLSELVSEMVGVRISALASLARIQAELRVRTLEQRMAEAVSQEGDWRRPLLEEPNHLLAPVDATGAALLCDGDVFTVGDVPATRDLKALVRRLARESEDERLHATSTLATRWPEFAHLMPDVAGLMAARLSASGADWLLWFRPEQVHTVTWGGDPGDAVLAANDLKGLSPRRSFAAWHQSVVGTSARWSPTDRAFGRLAGNSIEDVLLQFRAVRVLIARDQLRRVDEVVRASGHPAVIVDGSGRMSLANRGFASLFGDGPWTGRPLEELAGSFADPPAFLSLCRRLLDQRQLCRAELSLPARDGVEVPVFIRADVIAAGPSETLGFVIMFTDRSERRAADRARAHFQRIVESARNPLADATVGSTVGRILDGVLDNVSFAAMELAEGVEIAEASEAMKTLEASVRRSRRLLQELVPDWKPPN